MAMRRRIYAMVMVMIYIVATTLSSASLLICDHHHAHVHHTSECHKVGCTCHGMRIAADCCSHHHPILGDNHTDYIDVSQRNDSRQAMALALILLPALLPTVGGEQLAIEPSQLQLWHGDEAEPLRAAYISTAGLRAPPVLA